MKAIVTISGSQYQVTPGMTLKVNGQLGDIGKSITLPVLLYWDKDSVKIGPSAKACKVSAKITNIAKGDKIKVMRFRNKVRHRRRVGFRQYLTTLIIDKIQA